MAKHWPPRILAVDDDAQILNLLKMIFRRTDYQLMTLQSSPKTALLAQYKDFDLFILDLNMPGLNGFEVMHQLKSELPELPPVILLTASNRPEDRKQAEQMGMIMLQKNFLHQKLFAVIDELLAE